MTDSEEKLAKDIILGGGLLVVAYFGVVKPLMNMISDPADENLYNETVSLPPSENPFSYLFQYGKYATNPNAFGADYWHQMKANYDDGLIPTGDDANEAYSSELLHDAFGFWHNARVDDIEAVFGSFQYQSAVSNVAAYLFFNYSEDLLPYLRGGFRFIPSLPNGLTYGQLSVFINRVNNLPEQ